MIQKILIFRILICSIVFGSICFVSGYVVARKKTLEDFQGDKCWINKQTLDVECVVLLQMGRRNNGKDDDIKNIKEI